MKKNIRQRSWAVFFTFVFITLAFTLVSSAQTRPGPFPGTWDTAMNPHDFTNKYYAQNGVHYKGIIWRRNGSDGLSVFDNRRYTIYTDVRVIVTVPAYNHNGEPYFWYPLGETTNTGFTDDRIGFMARETAKHFPMYLFPDEKYTPYNTIAYTRQAPLIDNSWAELYAPVDINPLGLREIFLVRYTDKVNTPEGQEMMKYLYDRNGVATDGTPMIKSLEDMEMLKKYECITLESPMTVGPTEKLYRGSFAIAPVIKNPTKGVIAKDAFLWFSTRDGKPLAGEMLFVNHFGCLQKAGDWCPKG